MECKKDRSCELNLLQKELEEVLAKINSIRPIQFLTVDDDCVHNFIGLSESVEENRVYIQLGMWNDNLPAHRDNPLKDNRGNPILPTD